MSISTDGQICFGIMFKGGYEFPWGDDIEAWLAENKYQPLFQMVNYCSDNCSAYILAISDTLQTASRGYPVAFKPKDLSVSDEKIKALLDFCEKYELKYIGKPAWYLSSYWG